MGGSEVMRCRTCCDATWITMAVRVVYLSQTVVMLFEYPVGRSRMDQDVTSQYFASSA